MQVHNKLVRDNIPDKIRNNGEYARTKRKLTDEEYKKEIDKKLYEELKEVMNAKTKEELTEELADLFEVIIAKAKIYDITIDDIEKVRIRKKEKLGCFDKKVFLRYTYTDEDIKRLSRKCETCDIKNTCTLPERLEEKNNGYENGFLCINYIPKLYKQKTGKTK